MHRAAPCWEQGFYVLRTLRDTTPRNSTILAASLVKTRGGVQPFHFYSRWSLL